MYNLIISALKMIYSGDYNHENPLLSFRDFRNRNMLFTYNKQDIIIHQNTAVNYVYFLLKGTAIVHNSIEWTNSDIVDTLVPLDILGLVELLNNRLNYTSYVIAETPCIALRLPAEQFLSIIKENSALCYETLCIFGKLTEHSMHRAEMSAIFHPSDRLGHFLYLNATEHLPYIYPNTRKKLAEDLYINLRSLYRYLDAMERNGLLSLKNRKIIITEEHYRKLDERYGSVIL